MKKQVRRLWFVALVAIGLVACSNDDTFDWPMKMPESVVEQIENGGLRTTFYLPPAWGRMAETDVQLEFKARHQRDRHLFDGKLTVEQRAKVVLDITQEQQHLLSAGDYQLRCYIRGEALPIRFRVRLRNKQVEFLEMAYIYSTYSGGNGTAEKPYEIKDAVDFWTLTVDLGSDDWSGNGLYFKQTASFSLPARDGLVNEEGWLGETFEGSYDGGGFMIEDMFYQGGSSNVGLFRTLQGGAEVKNLTIEALQLKTSGDNIGLLAGFVSGNVKIQNCKVSGVVKGKNGVGGLIGKAYTCNQLEIDHVDLEAVVECEENYAGTLIGHLCECQPVVIDAITTERSTFSVSGKNYVGGLIGYADNTSVSINDVRLIRTSYATSAEQAVVNGTTYVGGLVGRYYYRNSDLRSRPLDILNSTACFTVRGSGVSIGGIVGECAGSSNSCVLPINLTSVTAASSVSGNDAVGGVIGWMDHCALSLKDCVVASEKLNFVEVTGRTRVGGVVGYAQDTLLDDFEVYLGVNVSASETYAGGCFGVNSYGGSFSTAKLTTVSSMTVSAPSYVGGLVGQLRGESIMGDYTLDYGSFAQIPKENDKASFQLKVSGTDHVGGVVGWMDSNASVKNIHVRATINGLHRVGGVVGCMNPGTSIYSCAVSGTVTGRSDTVEHTEYTGGLVGFLDGGTIKQSINYATVKGRYYTGGLVGKAEAEGDQFPYLEYSVNVGPVTGTDLTGGNIGWLYIQRDEFHTIVKYCANFGMVICESGTISNDDCGYGGIVGNSNGAGSMVIGCANHGQIVGKLRAHGGGGIAGAMGNDPSGADSKDAYNFLIQSCVNTGDVSNENAECHLGGILGYAEEGDNEFRPDAAVIGCLNKGRITSKQDWSTGGIVGELDWYGHIEYCSCIPKSQLSDHGYHIWEGGVKYDALLYESYRVRNVVEYTSKSADAFSSLGTTYWNMPSGTGYPTLKDCPFQSSTY